MILRADTVTSNQHTFVKRSSAALIRANYASADSKLDFFCMPNYKDLRSFHRYEEI